MSASAATELAEDRGSILPLILGFFVLALLLVGGSVAVGQSFVQQRDLQDVCDGAAAAAVASSADLDRQDAISGGALQLTGVQAQVEDYLARDTSRAGVEVGVELSADRRQVTLHCRQRRSLPLGALVGRGEVVHTATSSARAAVLDR